MTSYELHHMRSESLIFLNFVKARENPVGEHSALPRVDSSRIARKSLLKNRRNLLAQGQLWCRGEVGKSEV